MLLVNLETFSPPPLPSPSLHPLVSPRLPLPPSMRYHLSLQESQDEAGRLRESALESFRRRRLEGSS